jgi:hypothetical protein
LKKWGAATLAVLTLLGVFGYTTLKQTISSVVQGISPRIVEMVMRQADRMIKERLPKAIDQANDVVTQKTHVAWEQFHKQKQAEIEAIYSQERQKALSYVSNAQSVLEETGAVPTGSLPSVFQQHNPLLSPAHESTNGLDANTSFTNLQQSLNSLSGSNSSGSLSAVPSAVFFDGQQLNLTLPSNVDNPLIFPIQSTNCDLTKEVSGVLLAGVPTHCVNNNIQNVPVSTPASKDGLTTPLLTNQSH